MLYEIGYVLASSKKHLCRGYTILRTSGIYNLVPEQVLP